MLANALSDIDCDIYQLYDGDAVLVFSGKLDACTGIGARVSLTAAAVSIGRKVPATYILPPLCNHIVPTGTVLHWANDTITLEKKV